MDGLPTTADAGTLAGGEHAHLARLFAMSPDLLAAAGFDGRLKAFNDAWEQQLGFARAELEATPYLELVHPEDRAETERQIARLAAGETIAEYVCRLVRRDGGIRCLAWSGGPGDEAFYIVGRDVTERLALERELAERAERLERTNEELRHFAYIASHDLSEPLRTVAGHLSLVERRAAAALDGPAQDSLAHALDGAARMRRLIDDLLRYSQVANATPARELVDLRALAQEVVAYLAPAIEAAGARVEVDALPTVAGEPGPLAQLLQNLIANAVKFHAPGRPPVVHVSAERDAAGWVLSVADDGIGIPEAEQERVFAMFARLHDRDGYAGTGIGLALCRRIAERHGGRIWVDSVPGRGSTFHVLLPA